MAFVHEIPICVVRAAVPFVMARSLTLGDFEDLKEVDEFGNWVA